MTSEEKDRQEMIDKLPVHMIALEFDTFTETGKWKYHGLTSIRERDKFDAHLYMEQIVRNNDSVQYSAFQDTYVIVKGFRDSDPFFHRLYKPGEFNEIVEKLNYLLTKESYYKVRNAFKEKY